MVIPWIGHTLGRFQHRVDLHLAVIHTKRYMVGRWKYMPLDAVMVVLVIEEVDSYFLSHHNTISQYIITCQILKICMEAEWWTVARVTWRRWDKGGVDLDM